MSHSLNRLIAETVLLKFEILIFIFIMPIIPQEILNLICEQHIADMIVLENELKILLQILFS